MLFTGLNLFQPERGIWAGWTRAALGKAQNVGVANQGVNEPARAEQLARCAQRRGRITRGPSAGKRVGMRALWRGPMDEKARQAWKFEFLFEVLYRGYVMTLLASGCKRIPERGANMTARGLQAASRASSHACFLRRLSRIVPLPNNEEGYDEDYVNELNDKLDATVNLPAKHRTQSASPGRASAFSPKDASTIIRLAFLTKNKNLLSAILSVRRSERITLILALRFFERAAYLAHVTRHIRPPSQHNRSKRPRPVEYRPQVQPNAPTL